MTSVFLQVPAEAVIDAVVDTIVDAVVDDFVITDSAPAVEASMADVEVRMAHGLLILIVCFTRDIVEK